MRAVEFKIEVDSLRMGKWEEWKRADQDCIMDAARKNNLTFEYDPKFDEMIFTGRQENMYLFMFDIAYRYDIELI